MGHMLSTVNPDAAERVAERPLPDIGEMVWYFPRSGERRRGRTKVAAIVTHVDADNRRLDLAIIHEANDMMDQENVPERVGDDRGWLRIPKAEDKSAEAIGALRDEIAELRALILGEFKSVPMSVVAMIASIDDRVEVLEKRPVAAQAKKQWRKAKKKPQAAKAPQAPKAEPTAAAQPTAQPAPQAPAEPAKNAA